MRAVVFDSFGNRFDFVELQKLFKVFVFAEDFGGDFFMVSGVDVMAEIMIGGGSIDDVGIERLGGIFGLVGCVGLIGKFKTATDNVVDMADLMTPLIFGILRKDMGFDVGFQLGVDF